MHKLRYSWVHIILLSLFIGFAWQLVYAQAFKPSKAETLHVFITSEFIQTNELKDSLLEELSVYGIKKIIITYVSYDDPYYSTQLLTQGILDADILILPKTFLSEFDLSEQFRPLDTNSLWSSGLNPLEFNTLNHNSLTYAISIYEVSGYNHFSFNHRFDESLDYHVTFNQTSIHSDTLLMNALMTMIKRD